MHGMELVQNIARLGRGTGESGENPCKILHGTDCRKSPAEVWFYKEKALPAREGGEASASSGGFFANFCCLLAVALEPLSLLRRQLPSQESLGVQQTLQKLSSKGNHGVSKKVG